MPDLTAPGYTRYPGQSGINRRNNALAIIRRNVNTPAYANARRILTEEFGYTASHIMQVALGGGR